MCVGKSKKIEVDITPLSLSRDLGSKEAIENASREAGRAQLLWQFWKKKCSNKECPSLAERGLSWPSGDTTIRLYHIRIRFTPLAIKTRQTPRIDSVDQRGISTAS